MKTKGIDNIFDTRISKSVIGKDYKENLVQWHNKLIEDSSWLSQVELELYDTSQIIRAS